MSNIVSSGAFPMPYDTGHNPTLKAELQLNSHDRFFERDGCYFNLCAPFSCHKNILATSNNVYQFAQHPEE
jgi:hypothetical protein